MATRISLINAATTTSAVKAVEAAAPGMSQELEDVLSVALTGRPSAARKYVRTYARLTTQLLDGMRLLRPDLVLRDDEGQLCISIDNEGACSRAPVQLLMQFAAEAPFSPWVSLLGEGSGVALEVLSRARATLPGLKPLALPRRAVPPDLHYRPEGLVRFVKLVQREVEEGTPDLERIKDVFALTNTELAHLFGVQRQAVGQWLSDGPPPARAEKVATVAQVSDVLATRLKRTRIPGIARKAAAAYQGLSMLEMIAKDRHQDLLQSVRRSFDYALVP